METMVHARGQAERRVLTVAIAAGKLWIDQELRERVRHAFGLDQHAGADDTRAPHDGVARAHEHAWIRVDRPRAGLELSDEAVVETLELGFERVVELEIREQLPGIERGIA